MCVLVRVKNLQLNATGKTSLRLRLALENKSEMFLPAPTRNKFTKSPIENKRKSFTKSTDERKKCIKSK
jgi:predicted RNA-binding protein with RPS1 domain